jgi:hypothetical protein
MVFGCWNVDAKGALSARPPTPVPGTTTAPAPGTSCLQGLCWPAPANPEDAPTNVRVAVHLDGKRAAVLAGERVHLFDVPGKKLTKTFPLRRKDDTVGKDEITNGPVDLWFIGETVFVLGHDAGPAAALFPYSVAGRAIGPMLWGMYLGGAAIDEDKLVYSEDELVKLHVLDGRGKIVRSVTRKLPRSPCKPEDTDPDFMVPEDYRPGADKCVDYRVKHFVPYRNAQIVTSGTGYVGLAGGELFTLDARLAETSRVKLARCKR